MDYDTVDKQGKMVNNELTNFRDAVDRSNDGMPISIVSKSARKFL